MLVFSIYFLMSVVFSVVYFALNHTLKSSTLAGLIWPLSISIMLGALIIKFGQAFIMNVKNGSKKSVLIN